MTTASPDRIKELFFELVDLDPEDRQTRLDELCADNPELREHLDRLLEASERTDDALDGTVPRHLVRDALATDHDQLPERIGPFRIIRRLGVGGSGIVYEAEQTAPSRRVAIKTLRTHLADPGAIRRFRREADFLASLRHPGIAQIFEIHTDGAPESPPYIVMELVEGTPLTAFADEEALDTDARLALLARVCETVEHAHQHRVIHRDLKPDNILVEQDGRPRILDFGIARPTYDSEHTRTVGLGNTLGTIAYMAPEQASQSRKDLGPQIDVYALGVIAFELLTGRRPHQTAGLSSTDVLEMLAKKDAPRLAAVDRALRGDIDAIIGTCLEIDPGRRYNTAGELAADIRRHLAHEPILARSPNAARKARKFVRRNRTLTIAACTIFAALIGVATASTRVAARESEARENLTEARKRDSANMQEIASLVSRYVGDQRLALRILESALDAASTAEGPDNLFVIDLHRKVDHARLDTGDPALARVAVESMGRRFEESINRSHDTLPLDLAEDLLTAFRLTDDEDGATRFEERVRTLAADRLANPATTPGSRRSIQRTIDTLFTEAPPASFGMMQLIMPNTWKNNRRVRYHEAQAADILMQLDTNESRTKAISLYRGLYETRNDLSHKPTEDDALLDAAAYARALRIVDDTATADAVKAQMCVDVADSFASADAAEGHVEQLIRTRRVLKEPDAQ